MTESAVSSRGEEVELNTVELEHTWWGSAEDTAEGKERNSCAAAAEAHGRQNANFATIEMLRSLCQLNLSFLLACWSNR